VVALSGVLVAVGCSGDDEPASESVGAAAATSAPADDVGSGDGGVEAAASTTIDVSLTEFSIGGDLTAPAGNVVLEVTNDGTKMHNLVRRETPVRTVNLAAGDTAIMDLGTLEPGTYEIFCDLSGHESAGMVATLVVT
jgi:uncharacterized cupredoxin-like copper-binding protein